MEDHTHDGVHDMRQDALKEYRDANSKESWRQVKFPLLVLAGFVAVIWMVIRVGTALRMGEGAATVLLVVAEGIWFGFLFRLAKRIRRE